MTSLCVTLIANGLLITDTKISQTGCQVGLNKWYYGLTGLILTKLVIQFLRLMHFRRYNLESILIHVGGNFVLMPLLTLGFFAVNLWMLRIPYVSEEVIGVHYVNECERHDKLSNVIFIAYKTIVLLTYVPVFYYIVTTCMLFQCLCLVRTMVTRRIHQIRRNDH